MTTPAHDTIGGYLAEPEPVQGLWHHLNGLVGDESRATALGGLTLPAATIYLIGVFEGQVVQGGFRRFFEPPSGDHAQDTVQALREVGAHVSVELLEKALATASNGGDLAAFDELFNQHVDSQSPHRVERLDILLLDYMQEHADVRLTY